MAIPAFEVVFFRQKHAFNQKTAENSAVYDGLSE